MSKKRSKLRKKKGKKIKSNKVKGHRDVLSDGDIEVGNKMYDFLYKKPVTPKKFEAINNIFNMLYDQYLGNEEKHKEVSFHSTPLLNKENLSKILKKQIINIGETSLHNNEYFLHEEIIWLFNSEYSVLNIFDWIYESEAVTWNIGSNSHKSPDLIFTKNNKKIGVEITRIKRNNFMQGNGNFLNDKMVNQFILDMKKSSFELIETRIIDKKSKLVNYERCDKLYLIIITNPIGGSRGEFTNKVLMQEKINTIKKKYPEFDGIFVS